MGAPIVAILIQIQTTLTIVDTDVRFNLADPVLALAAPLLVLVGVFRVRDLYRIIGWPLLAALAFGSLALTGSLVIGGDAMGEYTVWALVKYVGWYVLLVYLAAGVVLGLTANEQTRRRFVLVFVAIQALVVLAFAVTETLSVKTLLASGTRLTGLAGNPNAMAFYLLCGVGLSFAFLGGADMRSRTDRLLLAAAGVLVAGTLFTRSVAALIALIVVFGAALALRILPWKRTLLVAILGIAIWSTPQFVETTSSITITVFNKLLFIVPVDRTQDGLSFGSDLEEFTLAARLKSYQVAFEAWREHPLTGTGLGTHLHGQATSSIADDTLVQIHSTPLWLLAETGLVGASAMFAVFAFMFNGIWRGRPAAPGFGGSFDPFAKGVLLVLLSWAVMALFHELMYQRVLWFLAGIALAVRSTAAAGLPRTAPSPEIKDNAAAASGGKSDVFFVIGSLQVGGAEVHLSRIAPQLARRGRAVTVYNFSGQGSLGERMVDAGVRVIGPPLKNAAGLIRPIQFVLLALSALKLYGIFLFQRPGTVHFFLPQTYIIGAILGRAAGLSRLVMSRRSLNYYQARHPLLARLERRLHRHMTVILGNSRRILTQLRDEENVPPEKLGLIYNGLDFERFDAPLDRAGIRRKLGIAPKTRIITIVANLIPYKGHVDLLRALAEAQESLPQDWVLLLVGRDDGIGGALRKEAAELGLADRVSFMGARDDVADILRISDIGVLCSHEEGFSNAILESMAAGLPMVVTDVGGNAEAVEDGVTGIVVPPRTPAQLGRAIRKLLKDPALRKRMGRAGYKRVRQHFSLDACVDKYQKLYDGLGCACVPEELSTALSAE